MPGRKLQSSRKSAILFALLCFVVLLPAGAATGPDTVDPAKVSTTSPPSVTDLLPMVWTREYTVRPGLRERFLELLIGRSSSALDRLVGEGVLVSWGVARPFNLVDGQGTHMLWLTMPGWAEADILVDTMNQLEAQLGTDALVEFEDTLVPGSRRDRVLRHVVTGPEGFSSDRPPVYLRLGFHRALPEAFGAAEALYRELHLPLCARLYAAGAVLRCGLSRQEVIAEPDWTHITWWQLESLADLGRLEAAFAEAADKTTAKAAPTFWQRYREIFDRSGYRTAIYRVLHVGAMAQSAPQPPGSAPAKP